MLTSNNFFTKNKKDRTNNYLEDLWSEIVVTFILRKRQTIEYKTQLTTQASIPEYIRALASGKRPQPIFPQRLLYVSS